MTRWCWRITLITAVFLLVANISVALTMSKLGLDIDMVLFWRRSAYMAVVSAILIWLSFSRIGGQKIQVAEPPGLLGKRRDQLLDSSLTLMASTQGARQIVMAFGSNEEPWVELRHHSSTGTSVRRVGPAEFNEELNKPVPTALFDIAKSRSIALHQYGPIANNAPVRSLLAQQYGINEGILVPLQTATGSGHIIVWDCANLSVDSLPMLRVLGDQIGHAIDREEMASLARNAAEAGVRQAVARDLHDSVAQFLAGTLFRLEALRRWIREGHDPESEIDSIKNALRREQVHLRQLIDRLRRGEGGDRQTELADELRDLLTEAGAHWHIETELILPDQARWVSVRLSYEIRQLVREAIANAVRHGQCRKVSVSLSEQDGLLKISIADDGIGFPNMPTTIRPRSITERVEALGGQLRVDSTPKGVRLDIAIRTGEFI